MTFTIVGMLYHVYDGPEVNKIYFVEYNTNYGAPVVVLNLEFEISARKENLSVENQAMLGKNIIRIAAYINAQFYYVEQVVDISDVITDNMIQISQDTNHAVMEKIISNTSWFIHLREKNLEYSGNEYGLLTTYSATPSLGDSLDSIDIAVISKIGRSKFTTEQFSYNWTNTGGYMINCVEWPTDSGNMLLTCLVYEIVRTTPSSSKSDATLEVELVADRQYRWFADTNTIEAYFRGTTYRMYDAKLAIACTQASSGSGYDYIWKQTTSVYNINSNNVLVNTSFNITKALALQFDKTGILSMADAIFGVFESHGEISGTSICTWPDDYNQHYASISHEKEMNTMLRGVRIDTEDHLLSEEGEYILLAVEVVDRDYTTSTTDVAMRKAINYVFSYSLRSKNAFWLWLLGGNDEGEITFESYKTYTR